MKPFLLIIGIIFLYTACNAFTSSMCDGSYCSFKGQCFQSTGDDTPYCFCVLGYTGRHCERFHCPCLNGGKCSLSLPIFCECLPGFSGLYCEQIVKAESHICHDYKLCGNHGKCISTGNNYRDYRCECSHGFEGERCEINLGVCGRNSSICENGGTCVYSKDDTYKCICVSGWEGEHCERNVDDCQNALCAPGSQCIDRVTSYSCLCPRGKVGKFCDIDDPCAVEKPCKEGSECIVDKNTGDYQCRCQSGFTGQDCSEDINECLALNISCGNNGICVNTRGSWRCECDEGFSGVFCETSISRCSPNICQNGGSCLDYRFKAECICAEGFHGKHCEKKCPNGYGGNYCQLRKCNSTSCLNGGSCLNGLCRCLPQYYGDFCQRLMSDPCKLSPCTAGKVCIPSANGIDYVCRCPTGFFSDDCQQEITACLRNPCENGGKCKEHNGSYTCQCELGYYGKNCEYNDSDDCESRQCLNGGICVRDNTNKSSCQCPVLYTGRFCQYRLSSNNFRCRNNGTCIHVYNSEDCICQCRSGFSGTYCEYDIDECQYGSVCINGGTCRNTVGSFNCVCPFGYGGEFCESKWQNCSSDMCMNGGECTETANGIYCHCLNGYYGERCEKREVKDCGMMHCKNGGSCIEEFGITRCYCLDGFTGQFCERIGIQCFAGLCLNNGTCVQHNSTYRCICQAGYTGTNCQQTINYKQYTQIDTRDIEGCRANNCSSKAMNGKCDSECNYFACNYDSGECSVSSQPFSKCKYSSFCAHSFHNGHCNPDCNNEECLFDGYDCEEAVQKCHLRDFCSVVYEDGRCNKQCNNSACGWDGGDCNVSAKSFTLDGDIRLVILVPPDEFIRRVRQFITTLSQLLRTSVYIKTDCGKPLIYEWNSLSGTGKNIMDISKEYMELFSINYYSRSKRTEIVVPIRWNIFLILAVMLTGTLVVLQVNTGLCHQTKQLPCFSDISIVVNYLGALTAKQLFPDFNMPLYSATAKFSFEKKTESLFTVPILLLVFGLALTTALYLVIQQSRKRKYLTAPVWMPPPSEDVPSSGEANLLTLHRESQCLECPYRKRVRLDSSATCCKESIETFLSTSFENCRDNEQEWTELHEEAMLSTSLALPINQSLVNIKGKCGRTPLMLVILNKVKDSDVAETDIQNLLEAGAQIDLSDEDGTTPLILAVKVAKLRIVDLLLKSGADSLLADNYGRTALHHAVALDFPDMVHTLLNASVNVNAFDYNNQTALMYAARYTFHPMIAEDLLQASADPNCTGDKMSFEYTGRTALHFAAQFSNLEVIQILNKYGAKINALDQEEQTPLFLAASEGKIDAVKLLISLGAAKDICNQNRHSPRDIAAEKMYGGIVEFLDNLYTPRNCFQNINLNSVSYDQPVKFKGYNRKTSMKSVKKSLQRNISNNKNIAANTTILTPPLSDASNYSGTPSPNAYKPQQLSQSEFVDSALHNSSVVLSPQFENNHFIDDQASANYCMYQVPVENQWIQPNISPCSDVYCLTSNNCEFTTFPQRPCFQYPSNSTGYCNV